MMKPLDYGIDYTLGAALRVNRGAACEVIGLLFPGGSLATWRMARRPREREVWI